MQILLEVCGNLKEMKKNMTDAGNPAYVTDDSTSFKYKASLLGDLVARDVAANADTGIVAHRLLHNAKIVVPLKYLSNYFRSLEMPLIN